MFDKFCQSCAAPLSGEFKSKSDKYCKYCTTEQGDLKSKSEVQENIAYWMQTWQPGVDEKKAMTRAEHYMRAMPEWAE